MRRTARMPLALALSLALVMGCDDAPDRTPATDDQREQLPGSEEAAGEGGEQAVDDEFFFVVEGLPRTEEHHVTVIRVNEEFEDKLRADPEPEAPATGVIQLNTEAVLGLAGVADGVSNLQFERSRVVIPGHPMEASTGFEIEGLTVEPGQTYHLLPIYAGEGTHRFYVAIDGEVRETYEIPEVALDGMEYKEIDALARRLRDRDDVQWWVHITVSADEKGWFRVDGDEMSSELVEVVDW